MKHCIALLTVAALLVTTLPAQAQEKYTIKLKKAGQGDTEVIEKTEVETSTMKVVDKDGKELMDLSQPKKATILVYRETILEKQAGARLATKVKRKYDLATVNAAGKTVTLPYQGKTLLIEKKDGDYRFTIEGGDELKSPDKIDPLSIDPFVIGVSLLKKDFNKKKETEPDIEKFMLPNRPVAVGETWKLDTAAFVKAMANSGDGMIADEAGTKGSGKLIKAYKKNGLQFGVLHIELTLPIKGGLKGLDVEKGTQMVITADMDVCIDGTVTLGKANGLFMMNLRARIAGQETGVMGTTQTYFTEVRKAAGPR